MADEIVNIVVELSEGSGMAGARLSDARLIQYHPSHQQRVSYCRREYHAHPLNVHHHWNAI